MNAIYRSGMLFSCFLLTTLSFAQFGPAGVGNSTNNALWLKADAGTSTITPGGAVSTWNDQSGNGINVAQPTTAQQPLFQTNVINGFPAIQFDNVNAAGQNDRMIGPDSPLLDNTAGYTFFTVSRPQTFSNASAIVTKRATLDNNHSFMLFFWNGDKFTTDIESSNNRFSSTFTFLTNNNYIVDVVYDGTLASSLRTKMYIGETLHRIGSESNAFVPDNASPLLIGSTHTADDRPFGGYIPEIIIYREALNKASRIIVNNYLSSKYDIALGVNDKYAGDTPANGNYDREVAGIGSDTIQPGSVAGSNNSFDASVGAGLGITYVSGFNPGDYILAGHASLTNSSMTSDVGGMTGADNCRWQRIWYVDVTNSGPNITTNIEFDMSDGGTSPSMGLATIGDYVLLYRPGQTGNWTELTTASSLVGDRVQFNNYTFTTDGYYTIGTHQCTASPLPIELTAFTAETSVNDVILNWETASEIDNAYFTLERSENAIDFMPIATVEGAGTSTQEHSYAHNDLRPGNGVHYYRLKQTDMNGNSSYSGIISAVVNTEFSNLFTVYPNPNNGSFFVRYSGEDETPVNVTITDVSGRTVHQQMLTGGDLRTSGIQTENLPRGYYSVHFVAGNEAQVSVIVVE